MKKLLFAIAGAAAFAAFAADPMAQTGDIDVLGFENFDLTDTANVTGAVVGRGDDGQTGTSKWAVNPVTGEDSSYVTNHITAPTITEPTLFANEASNTKYLALDTEGSELQRLIPNDQGQQTIPAGGAYIDTLVQFTVTEDEEPAIDAGTKLAIWLQAGDGVTNLYVKGGSYSAESTDDEDITVTVKSYKLSGRYEPGIWYRLTVKAINSIADSDWEGSNYPGFEIRIDGTPLTVVDDQVYTATALAWFEDGVITDTSFLTGGTFIPSAATALSTAAATITSVGFQGTGAIDDFVVTTNDPFPPAAVDFTLTLTLGSNVTSAEVTTNGVAVVFDNNGTAQIREGTEVSIAQPVFATNYHLDGLTTNTVAVASPTFPFAFTMTEAIEVGITAAEDQVSYPTYIDTTDTTIKGKYDAWKQAVGFDDSSTSTHLNQFLLNVDESATVGDTALEITEIKQNATAGWDITIGCTLDGVALTGTVGETIVCNGYLAVSYAASLTGPWHTENIAVTAVDATTGTVTVNVNKANAKFMKVTLTAAPATQE